MTYPPDYEEAKSLFLELKELDSKNTSSARRYELIHDIAEAHFHEAKDYFIDGLQNADPDYRYACISALVTHWRDNDPRVIRKLVELVKDDPDDDVRRIAAESLGWLDAKQALPVLKDIVVNRSQESDYVVAGAYGAILRILDMPTELAETVEDDFNENLINSELIESI